jgi:hypothetical protein
MSERAEKLRDAMTAAVHEPYPPKVFRDPPKEALSAAHAALKSHGSTLDGLSAFTIRGCVGPWTMERVARAIVEELGLSWADVRAIQPTPKLCEDDACVACRPARALATLLEAAAVDRTRQGGVSLA